MKPRPALVVVLSLGVALLVPLWGAYGMIGGGGGGGHAGHGGGEAHGGHGGGSEDPKQAFIDERKAFVAKNTGVGGCVWPPSQPMGDMDGMDHEGMDMDGMDMEGMDHGDADEGDDAGDGHTHSDGDEGDEHTDGAEHNGHAEGNGEDMEHDEGGDTHDEDMEGMDHSEEAPTVLLEAVSWTFVPQKLCLEQDVTYNFRMMATDVTHGASIETGRGSNMMRLPAGQEVSQEITFEKPGRYLVYCSYYCGIGHPFMAGRILVE